MIKKKIGFIVDSSIGELDDNIDTNIVKKVYYNIIDSNKKEYLDDNESLTLDMILNELENKKTFKTSAVSPGQVMIALEELFDVVDYVILFTVSSGLSSFYNNIKFLEEENKGKFFVVDTQEIGYGIKTMFNKVYAMANEGSSVEEIVDFAKNYYKNNFTSFTCESWEPLSNSGRAPKLLSKFLNKIQSKPVIYFYNKNRLGGIALGRGEKGALKSLEKMIELFNKIFENVKNEDIEYVYVYANKVDPSITKKLIDKISKTFGVAKDKILSSFAPNLVLIYTGIGSFGIHIRCKKEASDRE